MNKWPAPVIVVAGQLGEERGLVRLHRLLSPRRRGRGDWAPAVLEAGAGGGARVGGGARRGRASRVGPLLPNGEISGDQCIPIIKLWEHKIWVA